MDGLPFSHVIHHQVSSALMEDWGIEGDLTSFLVPVDVFVNAKLVVRESAVLCGQRWFDSAFFQVDQSTDVRWFFSDGDVLSPGSVVAEISGCARSIFSAERVALNFLQMLSGVATRTSSFVSLIKHTECQIYDSRKTLPGLRLAQKYAVLCGGGKNHRFGLYDMALIKDNHIAAVGGVSEACDRMKEILSRSDSHIPIMVEVETLDQMREALDCGINMIMLDNMLPSLVREAVKVNKGRAILEVSGGIAEDTVCLYAETGVGRISVGVLTKSLFSTDFSLQV
ncbi:MULTISPECIES: carboxylating nicotinate-nucleotide diphosphorylase [Candidatus Ichthyocystis]|uniref:Probable nicotinate-nucleotide pyrophosphorylase [carboxylating] n=1 Tax=Candidatus Ichthyocystis hellenicum TaxID=1561003 RepID=A0A0S4M0X4_9BURK|nr:MULTISPECIES: carboxylating nicotinate-nucleotide diphosphorylase [Ichthyocystis]CUT17443.1 Nicotinate-nucleotide pyrophosphorylase [Candidatus Ichthyocystis hellenicum]